ncbi:MAG: hypothetical protein CSA18_02370 [Deltaproteobacteria bacterium]|nr:MAG: hypothetical protein CSB21_01095 [Deltaproteobacteria bacterium]PIE74975.1 MAG: hypothetical protein CSA18_02370 [Deltaproteobacteria bacterium]
MLRFIRNRASSWIVKFILGLIIVVFVFFGWGTYQSGKINEVAEVNGEVITINEYKEAYGNMLNRIKAQFGGNLSSEMIKMFNIEKQSLNMLIEQMLILQEARKLGLTVSDEELGIYISKMDYFKTDNQFDADKYKKILAANRMSVEEFENNVRKDLTLKKVTSLVSGAVKVTDKELKAWYDYNRKTIDIKLVSFLPSNYDKKSIEIKDDEIKKYYDENKGQYKTEPMVDTVYIRFSGDDFINDVKVDDNEIKTYYQDNIDRYSTPETVRARHILVQLAPDASADAQKKAESKIKDLRNKVLKGEPFEEVASKYSEGPSASRGGDLGVFKRGDMVKPFSDAAFALKKGEVSQPVKTRFGWHIIKVEEKNKKSVKKLDEVKAQISKRIKKRKAKLKAYDRADGIYDSVLKGASLEEEAAARNIKLEKTGYFNSRGPEKGIADPAEFAKQAFSYEKGDTSGVIESGENMYILQVKDKKEPEIRPLAEIKDQIKKIILDRKLKEKAEKDAKEYFKVVKSKNTLDIESEIKPTEKKEVQNVKRQGFVKDFGFSVPELQKKIFESSSKKEKFPENIVKTDKGFYIFEILKAKLPSDEDFKKDKDEIAKKLIERKKGHFFNEWMKNYKKNSDIIISERYKG